MSFSDVSAEAAAQGADAEPGEAPAAAQDMVAPAEAKAAEMADRPETAVPEMRNHRSPPAWARGRDSVSSRKARPAAGADGVDPEDDVFLLGLEQEMLATGAYLDGLISKEVYVTETRALYDKAQSRMT